MGGAIPCLGYPSRTAAVLALRAQRLSTRDIARRVGIEAKTVSALLGSFARKDRPVSRRSHRAAPSGFAVRVDAETWTKLRNAGVRRGISAEMVALQLLMVAADDGLIDAILDDADDGIGEAA